MTVRRAVLLVRHDERRVEGHRAVPLRVCVRPPRLEAEEALNEYSFRMGQKPQERVGVDVGELAACVGRMGVEGFRYGVGGVGEPGCGGHAARRFAAAARRKDSREEVGGCAPVGPPNILRAQSWARETRLCFRPFGTGTTPWADGPREKESSGREENTAEAACGCAAVPFSQATESPHQVRAREGDEIDRGQT